MPDTPHHIPHHSDNLDLPAGIVPDIIPFESEEIKTSSNEQDDINCAHIRNMHTTTELPYQIYMLSDLFEDTIEVEIGTREDHTTLGLIVSNEKILATVNNYKIFSNHHLQLGYQNGDQG